jgi:hypothetical protein
MSYYSFVGSSAAPSRYRMEGTVIRAGLALAGMALLCIAHKVPKCSCDNVL